MCKALIVLHFKLLNALMKEVMFMFKALGKPVLLKMLHEQLHNTL